MTLTSTNGSVVQRDCIAASKSLRVFISSGGISADGGSGEPDPPDDARSALSAARRSAIYASPGIAGIGRAVNAVSTGFSKASIYAIIMFGLNFGSFGFTCPFIIFIKSCIASLSPFIAFSGISASCYAALSSASFDFLACSIASCFAFYARLC